MKALSEEEKRQEAELDKVIDAEVERLFKKRLSQWQAEREARKKLLEEVLAERKQQVDDKGKFDWSVEHLATIPIKFGFNLKFDVTKNASDSSKLKSKKLMKTLNDASNWKKKTSTRYSSRINLMKVTCCHKWSTICKTKKKFFKISGPLNNKH